MSECTEKRVDKKAEKQLAKKTDAKVDVLSRDKILADLKEILLLMSEKRQGKVFAIDGRWGYGKTYIIKRLEQDLEDYINEETSDNRYYIFHYNCWQYDYYDEPAIAIISAMLEKVNSEIDSKVDNMVNSSWEKAKDLLNDIAGKFVENKIGVNLVEVCKDINDNAKENKKNMFEFDKMFSFKQTLDLTREKIKEMAKYHTVLLVVDELDRCMPEYSIKVMERLHHLFDGLDNVIVLLAIDSMQLEHSIKEIYGKKVDTERYLKKFMGFCIKLDIGCLQDSFLGKYIYYFSNFDNFESALGVLKDIINLCKIDIRNLDKLIEKFDLIHRICFKGYQSVDVLLFEMMWGLMRFKILEAKNNGETVDKLMDLSWLPQIDMSTYAELDRCVSNKLISYLKQFKKSSTKDIIIRNSKERIYYINEDAVSMSWYLLDNVLANYKSFSHINDKELGAKVEVCSKFCDVGKRLW